MTTRHERFRQSATGDRAGRDNAMMLAALGILAYAASMMTHEALGHGGYCLAAGGHTTMLTIWRETCDLPGAAEWGLKAAGPGVQFGAGLLAWLMLRLLTPYLSPGAIRLRYFLWLYMAFNLLVSSGYVVFSAVTGFGDAAELIAPFRLQAPGRGVLALLGSAVYFASMRVAAFELKRFDGLDDAGRRFFQLVWIPYAAAGVFACCTAALNRTMGQRAAIGLAAASSFGAGMGLLFLPGMQRGRTPRTGSQAMHILWSTAWGIAAAAVIVLFEVLIGPGLE